MKLNLKKNLIAIDVETTGLSVDSDRIVQIAVIKINANGKVSEEKSTLVDPEMPISSEAAKVHKITNEMVIGKPKFKQIAKSMLEFIGDADFLAYNGRKFDIPILIREFERVGLNLNMVGRDIIDPQAIFFKMEPRNLKSAYKFYCKKELVDNHNAINDTRALVEILETQLDYYKGKDAEDEIGDVIKAPIVNDMSKLAEFSKRNPNQLDLQGQILINSEKQPIFNFGKYKGRLIKETLRENKSYYDFIMQGSFSTEIKGLIKEIAEIEK